MPTKVYGQSDDNIYLEGEYTGQCSYLCSDKSPRGILLIFSDGTVLEVRYSGRVPAVWEIKCHRKGNLLDRIDLCDDADAAIYSDIAYFGDGLKWVYETDDKWTVVQ